MPRLSIPALALLSLFAVGALLLGGCGFQPRGHAEALGAIPAPLHVAGISPYSKLGRELNAQLQRNGIETSPRAADGALVLRILKTGSDSRVLTLDSRNRVIEREIEQSAVFELRSPDNRVIAERQTVRVLRIQLTPRDTVLANRRQADLLRDDMRQELAQRILQRVAAQH